MVRLQRLPCRSGWHGRLARTHQLSDVGRSQMFRRWAADPQYWQRAQQQMPHWGQHPPRRLVSCQGQHLYSRVLPARRLQTAHLPLHMSLQLLAPDLRVGISAFLQPFDGYLSGQERCALWKSQHWMGGMSHSCWTAIRIFKTSKVAESLKSLRSEV